MTKNIKLISSAICFICQTLFLSSANAGLLGLDLRATGTALASKPDLIQLYSGGSTLPTYAPTFGFGGDILFSPPLLNWGFGLRYENLGVQATQDNLKFEAQNTRTAILVDYRFIQTVLLVGVIGSYGLSHTAGMKVTEPTSGIDMNWEAKSASSYSLGLEVGINLGFQLGAEAGYESLKWTGLTDKNNATSESKDLDMSGAYTKVFIGFGI